MTRLKRENLILWAVIALVAIGLMYLTQGCATTGVGKAYDAVYTATVTYDAAMQYAGDQYRQGNISEARKNKIIEKAKVAYNSIRTAQMALEVYKKAEMYGDQDELGRAEKALGIAVDSMNAAQEVLSLFVYD